MHLTSFYRQNLKFTTCCDTHHDGSDLRTHLLSHSASGSSRLCFPVFDQSRVGIQHCYSLSTYYVIVAMDSKQTDRNFFLNKSLYICTHYKQLTLWCTTIETRKHYILSLITKRPKPFCRSKGKNDGDT